MTYCMFQGSQFIKNTTKCPNVAVRMTVNITSTHTCASTQTHTHTCTHACIRTYTYIHARTPTHIYRHTDTHTQT